MFRFLAFFFSILALLIFGAFMLISDRKPSAEFNRAGNSDDLSNFNSSLNTMTQYNRLTAEEARVIINKGTERADGFGYKGEYTKSDAEGLYV